MMNVLLIGSGGREHAIARTLAKSAKLKKLYIAPGNPGTAEFGENISLKESDSNALLDFAKSKSIDLTIVGPEAPLVAGIVDLFEGAGHKIIGPSKAAAQLEGSKNWSKNFMKKYGIPTAASEAFTDYEAAKKYIETKNAYPIVIKADGLAAGKGVTVAANFNSAELALREALIDQKFKDAGRLVVIEAFLRGEEASILAFIDGKTIIPMVSAQDHKAVFDGDKGPNTGGMGAYSPAPIVTDAVLRKVNDEIFSRVLNGLASEGIGYKGVIYAGLMIENGIPSVVEFNARFGDPETQVVLPRLKTDLIDILLAVSNQTLNQQPIEWFSNATVCVVLAAKGYPGDIQTGDEIQINQSESIDTSVHVIQAGTARTSDQSLVTKGGRVLGVVGEDANLSNAIRKTYAAIGNIHFDGMHYRTDIGQKALLA